MHLTLDHASPVPLYHQIAEAIRYRVATGAIRPGETLPPLREAAALWGANLHTIRRAYLELSRAGLVATRAPNGTVILPQAEKALRGDGKHAELDRFLRRVMRDAKERHKLDPEALAQLLRRWSGGTPESPEDVYVAECSDTQSADLADQLMQRWQVKAVAWPIQRELPPAGRTIISTYFHYRDLWARWPERVHDARFVAITPDPALGTELTAQWSRKGAPIPVTLCEREESMARNIAADVARILPADRFTVARHVAADASTWLSRRRTPGPVLFSPRVWSELTPAARDDERAYQVRYVYEPRDLEVVGMILGWSAN